MGVVEALQDWVSPSHDAAPSWAHTAKTVGTLALGWASLELIGALLLRPTFLRMLAANPKLDAKKRAAAATQMLPRLVCFVHNVVQVPAALAVLAAPAFYAYPDRMAAASAYSTLVMAVSAGYFAYDTAECLLRFESEGPEFLLHGVFCFVVFGSLTHVRRMHWYGAGFLMWELSTPFMHLRWVLYKLAKDKGRLYAANGLLGMLVFFLCRVLWGPVVSLLFWRDSLEALAPASPLKALLPLGWVAFYRSCTFVMNGLNFYWFSKMARLAAAAARGGRGGAAARAREAEAAAKTA